MTSKPLFAILMLISIGAVPAVRAAEADSPKKKIVLIAGKKSHGPEGNGIHDYPWSARLLKVMLDNSNVAQRVRVEFHLDGWPKDPRTLEDADSIMVISDGRDGDRYEEMPFLQSQERLEVLARQMQRGCGLVTFHFSTFAPDQHADRILEWTGGYFDWQDDDGRRNWYSAIRTLEAAVTLGSPQHPLSRGLEAFRMKEEFYYNVRFRPGDERLRPIWVVPELEGRPDRGNVVAWAVERADGGRGFGTTAGHFYQNWAEPNFRTLILNALVWTAGLDVPPAGVQARYYPHAEILTALEGGATEQARFDNRPIEVLIVTGQQHPAHKWEQTTPAIEEALRRADPRTRVRVTQDVEFLKEEKLHDFDAVVMNYCNWKAPQGLSGAAKENFVKYLENGGGLVIVHFANGAWNFSLPEAGASDWIEWRTRICRRVWDHTPGKSGHDRYGPFVVDIAKPDHPITRGMSSFATTDELYFRQQGTEPIEVLATARSQVTGAQEPIAFVYTYGQGRIFQTVLGHDAAAILHPGPSLLIGRGAVWAAGRNPEVPIPSTSTPDQRAPKPEKKEVSFRADPDWTPRALLGDAPAYLKETDTDWVDGRLRQMDTGPFLDATIQYPSIQGKERAFKGTAIRIGDSGEAAVLFDRNQLRLCAGWTGEFLSHSDRRFALLNTPSPAGTVRFMTSSGPGWASPDGAWTNPGPGTGPLPRSWGRFRGLHLHGRRIVLDYTVGGSAVLESPWIENVEGASAISRTLEVGPCDRPRRMLVCDLPPAAMPLRLETKRSTLCLGKHRGLVTAAALIGEAADAHLEIAPADPPAGRGRSRMELVLAPGPRPVRLKLLNWQGDGEDLPKFSQLVESSPPPLDLTSWLGPRPARWTEPIVTCGKVSSDDGPYVVDTLAVPHDNPHQALMFLTGIDFLPSGELAVCTAHGDVWLVSGVDAGLETLTWKRFATGLYQPMGLKVVGGLVHVLERGQITRLHDTNGDREADFFENFNGDAHVGGGEHSFHTCLDTDPQGRFYFFATGDPHTPTGGCLLRVSNDGDRCEVFATGFRHPIGLCVSPTGLVTGADQQGNWMPSTRIDQYQEGGFYGDVRAHHRSIPPAAYDPPMCWLPHLFDNSAGGQVWVPDERFGPLAGHSLHLSYGRCRAMLLMRQEIDGVVQAGAVDLGLEFLSGVKTGRFRPADGHLYVVGLDGWQTAARQDGCLQRVRCTGRKVQMPIGLAVHEDGIRLEFTCPLDPQAAADPARYHVSRWNYRWSADYGSKDWSVAQPEREGRDPVPVRAASLLADGRSVFLAIDDLRPVMQMQIAYDLRTADLSPLGGVIYHTIHRLATRRFD